MTDQINEPQNEQRNEQRLDKWLWVARFYKTRSLAKEAVSNGKVRLNHERCEASTPIQAGDALQIRKGNRKFEVLVVRVSHRRVPAREALALYEDAVPGQQQSDSQPYQVERIDVPLSPYGVIKRERRKSLNVKKPSDG